MLNYSLDDSVRRLERDAELSPMVQRAKERSQMIHEFRELLLASPPYELVHGVTLDMDNQDNPTQLIEEYFTWISAEAAARPGMTIDEIAADLWKGVLVSAESEPVGTKESWQKALSNIGIKPIRLHVRIKKNTVSR